jgi:hypothetical protein
MSGPVEWSWTASEDPAQEAGEITINYRRHSISFGMASFKDATKLIDIIDRLRFRARAECISEISLSVIDALKKVQPL